jgi:hypothetical protein
MSDEELYLSPGRFADIQPLLDLMRSASLAVVTAFSMEDRRQGWQRYYRAKLELDKFVPPVADTCLGSF